MAIFTGAGVALATPFKENGDVNFEKLEELIDFQVENGTDAIIIMEKLQLYHMKNILNA